VGSKRLNKNASSVPEGTKIIAGGKQTKICAAPECAEREVPTLKGTHFNFDPFRVGTFTPR
jgi:hypothetical protein